VIDDSGAQCEGRWEEFEQWGREPTSSIEAGSGPQAVVRHGTKLGPEENAKLDEEEQKKRINSAQAMGLGFSVS
jgi:hypothetical protein